MTANEKDQQAATDSVSAMQPLALALADHVRLGHSVAVDFRRDDGVWYEQSTEQYFEVPDWLVDIEQIILDAVRAPVLDVGAASGRHALLLQDRGLPVTAIDSCAACVELMRQRGVRDVRELDVFELSAGQWHSVIFMMETIGLAGTLDRLTELLRMLQTHVTENGQILLDARPLQTEGSDGNYQGELELQMRYGEFTGEIFRWLYLDYSTLAEIATDSGWSATMIGHDEETDAYAARLCKK